MTTKKLLIICGAIVLIGVGFLLFGKGGSKGQEVSMLEPSDIAKGFYDQWLAAVKDPKVEPTRKTLAKSQILSSELRERLTTALETNTTPDPVTCQSVTPTEISMRKVFETADHSEVLVTSKDKKVTENATISFNKLNGGWYINDIKCSAGEFAPEREFTFDREGYLLKASIPAPFNKNNWHVVFEENGEAGHVAPIFFDAKSQCTALDGKVAVCDPTKLVEAKKVYIQGQMSERGVTVVKMKALE